MLLQKALHVPNEESGRPHFFVSGCDVRCEAYDDRCETCDDRCGMYDERYGSDLFMRCNEFRGEMDSKCMGSETQRTVSNRWSNERKS